MHNWWRQLKATEMSEICDSYLLVQVNVSHVRLTQPLMTAQTTYSYAHHCWLLANSYCCFSTINHDNHSHKTTIHQHLLAYLYKHMYENTCLYTWSCNLCRYRQHMYATLCDPFYDVVEAHATALNWTDTFLSIHVAKTDFSEMFRPRGSLSVTNNWVVSVDPV